MRINDKQIAHFARTSTRTDKHGFLYKRGAVLNRDYKQRWFVLKGNLLFYYRDRIPAADPPKADPIGFLVLERVRVETCDRPAEEALFPFKLIFEGEDTREYELAATSEEEMLLWMKALSEASYEYIRAVVADLHRRVAAEEARLAGGRLPEGDDEDAVFPPSPTSPTSGLHDAVRAMASLTLPRIDGQTVVEPGSATSAPASPTVPTPSAAAAPQPPPRRHSAGSRGGMPIPPPRRRHTQAASKLAASRPARPTGPSIKIGEVILSSDG